MLILVPLKGVIGIMNDKMNKKEIRVKKRKERKEKIKKLDFKFRTWYIICIIVFLTMNAAGLGITNKMNLFLNSP